MQQGPEPDRFEIAKGESVTIRVIGVGTGQFETVAPSAEKLMGDTGDGNVYRFTATAEPGALQHVLINFKFLERFAPPGHYKVRLEGPGCRPTFDAPNAFQPVGVFPQSVSYALTFVIV